MLYEFKIGSNGTKTTDRMCQTLGENVVKLSTVNCWFNRFRKGDFSLEDKERSGRPIVIENKDITDILREDPRSTCKSIGAKLGHSAEAIRLHLKPMGFKSKIDKWVPHKLSDFNKKTRLEKCKLALSTYSVKDLERMITVDEKWVCYSNESRKKSWKLGDEGPEQVPKRTLTSKKVLLICFWGCEGIMHIEWLNSSETLNSSVYCRMLKKVNDYVESNWSFMNKKKGVIFLQDNARPHVSKTAQNCLKKFNWKIVKHTPYSPDCSPSNYHLFLSLQNYLNGQNFMNSENTKKWLLSFLTQNLKNFLDQAF